MNRQESQELADALLVALDGELRIFERNGNTKAGRGFSCAWQDASHKGGIAYEKRISELIDGLRAIVRNEVGEHGFGSAGRRSARI